MMTLATCAVAVAVITLSFARAAEPEVCKPVVFDGNTFTVCDIDLQRYAIEMHWRGSDGQPFGTLGKFTSQVGTAGGNSGGAANRKLIFAMNAGMYHADLAPVGLYIENGEQLVAANTRRGPGNFHMMPNGVFFVDGGQVGVQETSRFLKSRRMVGFATQSGPMLVIDGQMHPKFPPIGLSQKIRNGVGVTADKQRAIFVVSDAPVTFTAFAKLFRDKLKCANALFLDGSISSLYAPSVNRADSFWPVGPIVSAFEK
jgi:uncharacterized protein YigE (DUF2233 family)